MKKRGIKILYSSIGVFVLFLIFAALNFIISHLCMRFDMTQEKLYTLSESTKKIVSRLDTPVTIKFYYTKSANMPAFLKNYAAKVQDLLAEYRYAGKGKIEIEKYDPIPDSEAEDSALMDGITGQTLNTGDKIYLGLSVHLLDETVSLPFLSSEREELLEYDITRAITQVTKSKKPVIGVISALPVMGQKPNPMMMQMGQFNVQSPWIPIKELKNDFELREIPLSAEEIDGDINLLIVIHPSGITDRTQFAIDQFLLKGGKMMAFLDPNSFYASAMAKNDRSMMMQPPVVSSTMDKLLKAWGIDYDPEKVVSDMTCARRFLSAEKRMTFPTVIDITKDGLNRGEVFLGQLESLTEVFGGAFRGDPAEGLKKTVLIESSEDSQLINSFLAATPEMAVKEFKPEGTKYALAIKLAGKFKTAFPDGKPQDKAVSGKDDEKDKTEIEPETEKKYLKEAEKEGVVILVGDSDMLYDEFCARVIPNPFGQVFLTLLNDNINFFQNAVEYMSGDSDLMGIRSRKIISRPFTLVRQIQSRAEQEYKNKIIGLEQELEKTQERINKLQEQKSKNQRFILSPEQKEEIKNFRQKENEVKKKLKDVRKQLRQEIDALEIKLKWLNIALMPAFVIVFGISLAIYKNRRNSAK